jgi:hypothetical protein
MAGAVIAGLTLGGIFAFWICMALGKRFGDELATWVVSNDDDQAPAPDFGLEQIQRSDAQALSMRGYRYYAKRYRQLRRARGEDVILARRFDIVYFVQQAIVVSTALVIVVGSLLFLD